MLKITSGPKLKVYVAALWVCLLAMQALWGERNPEPTGLAVDSHGDLYLSLIDSYRAEACLQKVSPAGKRLWNRIYQGDRVSGAESRNMIRITPKAIYQIVNENGKNSSYLQVLKYAFDGRRYWVKELSHQPYHKDLAVDGDSLVLLGMDRNFDSLIVNRVQSDGKAQDSVLLFNPFGKQPTWFRQRDNGILLAAKQAQQLKIMKINPEGQLVTSFAVASGRMLGVDRAEAIYVASQDDVQVAKYSDTGRLLWQRRLKRQWDSQIKEDLALEYLEFSADRQNTYLSGKAQLFTAKPNYKTIYDRNAMRYFGRRKYWRRRGGDRIFIARLNPNGTLAWTNYLVTNQHYPKVCGMAADQNGNVYLAGKFTFLDAEQNLYLAKYNHQGKLVWIRRKYQIPGSLFYLGLVGAFLGISLYRKQRIWVVELLVLISLILFFWGEALV